MSKMITGYRTLSDTEVTLINHLKGAFGATILAQLNDVRLHVNDQRTDAGKPLKHDWYGNSAEERADIAAARVEIARIEAAQPERWITIANTHFQEGLMALVRAVAQPDCL